MNLAREWHFEHFAGAENTGNHFVPFADEKDAGNVGRLFVKLPIENPSTYKFWSRTVDVALQIGHRKDELSQVHGFTIQSVTFFGAALKAYNVKQAFDTSATGNAADRSCVYDSDRTNMNAVACEERLLLRSNKFFYPAHAKRTVRTDDGFPDTGFHDGNYIAHSDYFKMQHNLVKYSEGAAFTVSGKGFELSDNEFAWNGWNSLDSTYTVRAYVMVRINMLSVGAELVVDSMYVWGGGEGEENKKRVPLSRTGSPTVILTT